MKQIKNIFFINLMMGFFGSLILLIPAFLYLSDYCQQPNSYLNLQPSLHSTVNLSVVITISVIVTIIGILVWYFQIKKLIIQSEIKFTIQTIKPFTFLIITFLLVITFFIISFFCIWLAPFASTHDLANEQIQFLALKKLIIYFVVYACLAAFLIISQVWSSYYAKKHLQNLINQNHVQN